MLQPACKAVPGAICRPTVAGSTSADLELGDLPTPAAIAAMREAAARRAIDRVLPTAVAATAQAAFRRVTGPARPTAVDTGPARPIAVVATPEAARCRAIARVPATGVAAHTDRILRIAAGVRTAVAAALLMPVVVAVVPSIVVVAGVVPSTAEAEEAEDPTLVAAGAANNALQSESRVDRCRGALRLAARPGPWAPSCRSHRQSFRWGSGVRWAGCRHLSW